MVDILNFALTLEYLEAARLWGEDLPLFPWHASAKPDFVRIDPEQVTGRRFHVVSRTELESSAE